jgi:glyoxylase I family protein
MFKPHHTALSVSDMAASVGFYSGFGFSTVFAWAAPDGGLRITHMRLGHYLLELFCFESPRPLPATAASLESSLPEIGVKHMALKVNDLEEAKRFVERESIAREVQVHTGRTGVRYFFVKDPDGILLEIVEDHRAL